MKPQKGFSLIELMTAMAVFLVVGAAAVNALIQAQRVTQGVALEANTQENLRAGMHFLVKDVTQAGEGLPPGGIDMPNSSTTVLAIPRPIGTSGVNFSTNYVAMTGVMPGSAIGQPANGINALTGAAVTTGAAKTDVITVFYVDNSLKDSSASANPPYMNTYPVIQSTAGSQICAGSFTATSVTLDTACFKMPGSGPTPITAGNLIMFQNQKGTALEYVTSVSGQTMNFATGDPGGLNALSAATYPNGTITTLGLTGATPPPTVVMRVWMVTYYVDSTTNPAHPQLVRQVNYPGYPTVAAQTNPPQPIADDIEDLGFTYDVINSTAPTGTYPNGAGDAPDVACWATPCSTGEDTPQQIRAVNIYLAGRSASPFQFGKGPTFFHNNLSTQVSIRSMAFTNNFNTSITTPQ